MRLREIKKLEGMIVLKSGLHIGSGNMEMHIGGTDSPVVKHPHTLEPYIPGSSLKGKVRSLLEMESGLMIYTNGGVVNGKVLKREEVKRDKSLAEKAEAIIKVFGSGGGDLDDETLFGPTRISFSDCYLDDEWKRKAKDNRWLFTEEKSENSIDRIKGTAQSPRFIERVPEGTKFKFLITFKVLQDGDEKYFEDWVLKGLKLLEMDALGGSGTRGYGRVALEFSNSELKKKFAELNPF